MPEDMLNELLTNVTLSSMALGIWNRPTLVNTTQYQNTYRFSQPLALVLPYSLCLGLGVVMVALELYSLHQNRVAVADGDFLQIAMASSGSTVMTDLFVKQGLTTPAHVSEELKQLQVRYGELVPNKVNSQDSLQRRFGFGTVEEILAMKETK